MTVWTGGGVVAAGTGIFAHTSHSGPNCRRNSSENDRNKTGTGKTMTVPMYGNDARQQVPQVTRQPTMIHPIQRAIMNRMKRMNGAGSSKISCRIARAASTGEQRRVYMTGGMK